MSQHLSQHADLDFDTFQPEQWDYARLPKDAAPPHGVWLRELEEEALAGDLLAHYLLRTVESTELGFTSNDTVAKMISAYRESARILWGDKHPKPAAQGKGAGPPTASVDALYDHARSLGGGSGTDLVKRLQKAADVSNYLSLIEAALPRLEGHAAAAESATLSKAWRTASLRLASHGSISSADAKRAQEAYSAPLDAAEQLADNDESGMDAGKLAAAASVPTARVERMDLDGASLEGAVASDGAFAAITDADYDAAVAEEAAALEGSDDAGSDDAALDPDE